MKITVDMSVCTIPVCLWAREKLDGFVEGVDLMTHHTKAIDLRLIMHDLAQSVEGLPKVLLFQFRISSMHLTLRILFFLCQPVPND